MRTTGEYMKIGNWTHLREKIKQDDSIIFQGVDKSTLSAYDKRKRIFANQSYQS